MSAFPKLTVVIGASTYRQYGPGEKRSSTARKFTQDEGYYDSYNTALQLDSRTDSIQTYHKSRLVPGVEKMPYPAIFGFLEKFAIDLGGMSGSLGREPAPKVFFARDTIGVAPIICYESVYGDYVAGYVKKGAGLLFIITNDGWWGNTPGHRQHLVYGRLRAIEMRRSLARSANTGISCFYNQRGDILQPTRYWEEDVISRKININHDLTFYARYGDYVAKMALIFTAAMLVLVVLKVKAGKGYRS
jgi:apolipoprotein N-acyltransferase